MTASLIGLVIFDCDGVLVDSEPLAMRVLLETLSAGGVELPAEEAYEAFLGKSLASVCEILRRDHALDLGDAALSDLRREVNRTLEAELQPMPGMAETLARLDRPVCVASSSQVERIRLSLEVTGLAPFFGGHVFSASMVVQGKPAPDLFLYAARQMRVAPSRCMVVEDSPAGVSAALQAGMKVLGFVGGSHARAAAHRKRLIELEPLGIFDDMRQLPGLLSELEEGRKVS